MLGALTRRNRAPWPSKYTPSVEQHVEVDVQIQRTAEALDQCDRSRLGDWSAPSEPPLERLDALDRSGVDAALQCEIDGDVIAPGELLEHRAGLC